MKRRHEFVVGLVILVAIALVLGGALFLSQADVGGMKRVQLARFRSIGRLQPGAPVLLRGVRIGTVQAVRLADNNWVEVELRIDRQIDVPARPAVVAVPASLFGEWQAQVMSQDQLPQNPGLQADIEAVARTAGDAWPGADMPGIGELTAQANRIANDVGLITSRVEGAIDSSVIADLRKSVSDLTAITAHLEQFAKEETGTIGRITGKAATISENLDVTSHAVRKTMARVDTATSNGELAEIMGNARSATANLRDVTADLKELSAAARQNRETLVRTLAGLDSVMMRLQRGQGTFAKLTTDSALYVETTAAVTELRALIADIRVNPRKYFRFSVF
jgi:phospholipid/cholesterol/gamma-HCH transport system substrate-binding protein